MSKVENYIEQLKAIEDWDIFLMQESNLPGPRGNLELIYAAAQTGSEEFFKRLIAIDNRDGSGNAPVDFLTMCAVVGLGKLVSEGKSEYFETLRIYASDKRWRLRESTAMALQLVGDSDMGLLISRMKDWSKGNLFEKRAAAAALCEPRLLKNKSNAAAVLDILDSITESLKDLKERRSDDFDTLKKGLGYCWSVAVVASPDTGKTLMDKWILDADKDILRIMKENLTKNRLVKMDSEWVEKSREILERNLSRI